MSNRNKGREFDQQTRDGTSNIGSMGEGSTGQRRPDAQPGNEQSAGRTDDLLSGGVDEVESEHGFRTGEQYRQGQPAPGEKPGKRR